MNRNGLTPWEGTKGDDHRLRKALIYCGIMVGIIFALTLLSGCAAPPQVQAAQKLKARALTNFLTNDAKIDGVVEGLWVRGREKEIKATASATARNVIALLAQEKRLKDGNLTPAQAIELALATAAEVQKANKATMSVQAKIKTMRDLNAKNLLQYSQLEGALLDYLAAGIDEAALDALSQYLVQAVTAAAKE